MSPRRRIRIGRFLAAILTAAVVATLVPARGAAAPVLDHTTTVLIAVLFLLYGVRLSPQESLQGLRNWRLHAVILAFTFVAFPVIGTGLRVLRPWFPPPRSTRASCG